jgi:diguanylate cyclase (GGDEF)-like protein/PAS domain S-box-containing protein
MAEPSPGGEERFWRALREASAGVALLDLEARVEAANPALCELLQAGPEELAGARLAELVHPIYREGVARRVEEVLRGERCEWRGEAGLVRHDGTLAWSGLSLFLARSREGAPEYALAIVEPAASEPRVLDAIHLLATTDELTGLHNRRGFLLLAEQQLRLAARKGWELALVYLDLDRLKGINDALGHRAGDDAIRQTAEVLRAACREMDVVARLGGDEFVVLMVEPGELGVSKLQSRLQRALDACNARRSRATALSVSVGISRLVPGEARTLEQLLVEADARMYEEKRRR